MKLAVCSTVPDILPFFKTESGNTRFKLEADNEHNEDYHPQKKAKIQRTDKDSERSTKADTIGKEMVK